MQGDDRRGGSFVAFRSLLVLEIVEGDVYGKLIWKVQSSEARSS